MVMADQWLPGPRRHFKVRDEEGEVGDSHRKILVVLDPRLFGKRDSKGLILDEMSEDMLCQASSLYDQVMVFCEECQACRDVRQLAEDIQLKNVEVTYISANLIEKTEELRKRIIAVGGKIKVVRNPREITFFSMEKFVLSGYIVFARRDDWKKVGLELDKPKTFQDVQKERKTKTFW
jgi:hypothetical protein